MKRTQIKYPLSLYNPVLRLCMLCAVLIITMFCSSLYAAAVSFFGGALTLCLLRTDSRTDRTIRNIFSLCGAVVVITLLNPLFSHRGADPLLFINGRAYTLQALLYGLNVGLSLCAVVMWFTAANRLISKPDMLALFSRYTPRLAMTVSMILGYIPQISRRYGEISSAQKGSGIYVSNSRTDRAKFGAEVFSAVTGWSAEHSAETAQYMRARGFGRLKGAQLKREKLKFSCADILLTIISAAGCGVCLWAYSAGECAWDFYPKISIPKEGVWVKIFYVCTALSAFMPALLVIKERLKWRYLAAKI